MFELEATEETVQAAQQEEEITRMNNSLVLPVSSTQTTTNRIESSVFIPVQVSSDFVPDMERRNIEFHKDTFDE